MLTVKKRNARFKLTLLIAAVFLSGCSIAPKPPTDFLKPGTGQSPEVRQILRGVFHVHTKYSHDSSGSISSIIKTARKNGLDFVVITDHNTTEAARDAEVLRHTGKPLLIVGNELSTTDGHLIALGVRENFESPINPQNAVQAIRKSGGVSVLAHPVCEKSYWKNWDIQNFDAMEVYNHACDFYDANKLGFAAKTILFSPSLFAKHIIREPRESIEKWDSLMLERGRIISAVGALDAHVRYRVLGFPIMRYANSFPIVTLHVSADSLSEKEILKNIAAGRGYLAFESRGRAQGFLFQAQSAAQIYKMGEMVKSEIPLSISVKVPKKSEIRLIYNGRVVKKVKDYAFSLNVKDPGIYRVEVFRNGKIWILSNPIMVQA